ncbi:hypothetical protein ES708_14396 [subsurface metagenome]
MITVDALLFNRTLYYLSFPWSTVHDNPTGWIYPGFDSPNFLAAVSAGFTVNYFCYRPVLRFDTSFLPAGSVIIDALITLYVRSVTISSHAVYTHVIATPGVQHTPVIVSDYGDQLPITQNLGQVDLNDCIVDDITVINLNSAGKDHLTREGLTRFCIRQEMDLLDYAPPLGSNTLTFSTAQAVYWQRPKLVVRYAPPPPP